LEYARIKVLEVLIEGVIAYAVCRAAGVPGAAALAVWVGLWTLLPVAGVLIGALPIVAFAGASSLSRAVVVASVFVAVGLIEYLLEPIVERETGRVGPFLTVLATFAGLELYGLMGALLALLAVIMLAAFVAEMGPEDVAETIVAPLTGVPEDETEGGAVP
jgi:predicted PurR-regulated permease PerM